MFFEIIDDIACIENIAVGRSIRELKRLGRQFGPGRWRKLKGIAKVRLPNGRIRKAELHWYQVQPGGKRKPKNKRYLD